MNPLLKKLLGGFPPLIQYLLVFAAAMIILFLCLVVTRKIGEKRGSTKYTYDDPEKNDKSVPDLFASTMFRRKPKQRDDEPKD